MVTTIKQASIWHLFRPLNLLISVLTMYLLRWGLLIPMLKLLSNFVNVELVSQISNSQYAALVLSVVLIGAGGFVLNDIEDVVEDTFNNRPNPVGKLISEKNAMRIYYALTFTGLALSFGISYQLGNYNYGFLQLSGAITMWFYSTYFKSRPIGNLLIALSIGVVPLFVGIYEVSLLQIEYVKKITTFSNFNFNILAYWFMAYSAFAFLMTWAREIIKDVEDMQGDARAGARTLPIVYGKKNAYWLTTIIYLVIIGSLIYVQRNYLTDTISLIFILITIILIVVNIRVMWLEKKWILSPGNWNKLISVIGVLYLGVLGYIINNKLFF